MRRQLDLALERELQQDVGISLPDFEILLALFDATGSQLRARELGTQIGWEKSRLSHQVTRMEARGLVQRTDCATDARGTWIEITDAGRSTIRAALRDHALTIRRLFFDILTDAELATLQDVSGRVIAAIDPPDCDDSTESASHDGAA
jgi:DNA-binding MarR family transcriptional regulator